MKRIARRGFCWLDIALALTIFSTAATTACREPKKDEAPVADAAASVAVAPVAVPETAPSSSAAHPPEGELEDIPDGGGDGGVRKRRRLVAAGTDAGSADTQTAAAPAPSAETAGTAKTGSKRPPTPMGNDEVYGASAAPTAPALKKKPLPDDDPYPKPAAPR